MSSGGAGAATRGSRWKPIATAAAGALGVAILGAITTDIGPWYLALKEPPWKPPDILFGPAWTTIFALAAISGSDRVEVSVKVDPTIIGGLIVQLGSRMVDGSLKTKLASIRTRMKEVG